MTLTVIDPGGFATIQDNGRRGWQQYGVSVGGPLDEVSFRIANALVGNDTDAAAIEVIYHGPDLRLETDLVIALCGAGMDAAIDGVPLPMWRPVYAKAGSSLRMGRMTGGGRCAYLAVAGGIHVPAVLGSRSASVRGAWHGMAGRALRRGDRIPSGGDLSEWEVRMRSWRKAASFQAPAWVIAHQWRVHAMGRRRERLLRVLKGREWDWFTDDVRESLAEDGLLFTVRSESDRMGYRLEGKGLPLASSVDMLSEAVTAGTMQVPPDGRPIVLMADRQTTGGYPRLLQIAAIDLPAFAQTRPGEQVRFRLVELEEATDRFLQRERGLRCLQWSVYNRLNTDE